MIFATRRLILLIFLFACPVSGENGHVLFHEDFNDLKDWKPLEFQEIKKHSRYSVEREGAETYLKAESESSASGIIFNKSFNVFDYPGIRWRWKISNVYQKGNVEEKSGDDCPARVYIIFRYDPDKASLEERIKYGLLKTVYGDDAPYRSLVYVWASRKHNEDMITSPYSSKTKLFVLRTGDENAGRWLEEEVNIVKDYRKAFGKEPPAVAGIAIMNDSDNTGERSVSYMDYIEAHR